MTDIDKNTIYLYQNYVIGLDFFIDKDIIQNKDITYQNDIIKP